MSNYKSNTGNPNSGGNDAEKWLKSNVDAILDFKQTPLLELLLDHLKTYIQAKGKSITTSQLRNIFSRVKPARTKQALQLIRPRLAYVAARQNDHQAKAIVEFLEDIIAQMKKDEQADDFAAFFEAIVAYHKLYCNTK